MKKTNFLSGKILLAQQIGRTGQNDFVSTIIRRCIFSWLAAAVIIYIPLNMEEKKLDSLKGLQTMSFPIFLLFGVSIFGGLCVLAACRKAKADRLERWGLPVLFGVLAVLTLLNSFSIPYFCILVLTEAVLTVYAVYGRKRGNSEDNSDGKKAGSFKEKTTWARLFAAVCAVLFFVFVGGWTVFRVLTYSAPTYDFGIFSQMFHRMSTTGLAETTLERDGLLSHYQVHVSPIYYLLLPFYWLFPKPATLQVLQAALLAAAAVPAWKLARTLRCSPWESALLCVLLFLYPSYGGGASYDLHENAFLTPLLLWMFYMIERENQWGTVVFCILTCMVKEDAAVYTAVIGLWLLIRSLLGEKVKKRFGIKAGLGLLVGSALWFTAATGYLAHYGDGVMTNRYSNLIYDGSGSLITVIKAVLLSPMKVFYECADPEKLKFIGLTILPLCGIPFMTRKYERFLLLIPYVLVNLLSDYQYQHDIFFQYTYGSTACLFYLTAANYADLTFWIKKNYVRFLPVLLMVLISGVCFAAEVLPKAVKYPARYWDQRVHFREIKDKLENIPKDASVAATTFYTVPLSGRKVIYDVRYTSQEHLLEADYVVLAWKDEGSCKKYAETGKDGYTGLVEILEENGYEQTTCLGGTLVIYRRGPGDGAIIPY